MHKQPEYVKTSVSVPMSPRPNAVAILATLACFALSGCLYAEVPHSESYGDSPAGREILEETAPNMSVCLQRLEERAGGKKVKLISEETSFKLMFWPGAYDPVLTCRGLRRGGDEAIKISIREHGVARSLMAARAKVC
jgi:hypothetical protein